jgi:hypothetical protein
MRNGWVCLAVVLIGCSSSPADDAGDAGGTTDVQVDGDAAPPVDAWGSDDAVPLVDTGTDAAVVDAGGDAAHDTGPTFPDLNATHTSLQMSALWESVPASGTGDVFSMVDQSMSGCGPISGMQQFSVRVCVGSACDTLTGFLPPGTESGTYFYPTGQSVHLPYAVQSGPAYGVTGSRRQNFHVQFSFAPNSTGYGAGGVAGETMDPARGDVWLLGCPLQ